MKAILAACLMVTLSAVPLTVFGVCGTATPDDTLTSRTGEVPASEGRLEFELITVGDEGITVDYFITRGRTATIDSSHALDILALAYRLSAELLALQRAGSLGIEVSEEEVLAALEDTASLKWYVQEDAKRGLTDAEYKTAVRADLLREGLREYLGERAMAQTDTEGMRDFELETLKNQAFGEWIAQEEAVEYHGFGGGGLDSTTMGWLRAQLQETASE